MKGAKLRKGGWTEEEKRIVRDYFIKNSASEIHKKYLKNRTPASIQRMANKLGVVRILRKDLTGRVIGKLLIVEYLGDAEYGGRSQSFWQCKCKCGTVIELFYDQIPSTKLQLEKMAHSGRRLYDCCEQCREKKCPICANSFSYSHPSHICPKLECQEWLRYARNEYWHNQAKLLRATDSEAQFKHEAYHKDYREKNKERDRLIRKRQQENMTDEKRELLRSKAKKYYKEIKGDPDQTRYRKSLESKRKWRANMVLAGMIHDAQKLQEIIEKES